MNNCIKKSYNSINVIEMVIKSIILVGTMMFTTIITSIVKKLFF